MHVPARIPHWSRRTDVKRALKLRRRVQQISRSGKKEADYGSAKAGASEDDPQKVDANAARRKSGCLAIKWIPRRKSGSLDIKWMS